MIKLIPTGPFPVNTFVVDAGGPDVFIVDPGCCSFSNDQKIIADYIQSKNLNVAAFILTHGHFDHVAGLSFLKGLFPSAPILISFKDKEYLGEGSLEIHSGTLSAVGFEDFIPQLKNLPAPDAFLKDGKNLFECLPESFIQTKGQKNLLSLWTVIDTPGHTPGSVCLYNKDENILISGDTLFYMTWGRTDFPEGNETQIMQSLLKIKREIPGDAIVFPGHDFAGFKLKDGIKFL